MNADAHTRPHPRPHARPFLLVLGIGVLLIVAGGFAALLISDARAQSDADTTAVASPHQPPSIDSTFWDHWGDGQAEIATYDLTYPRYGQPRTGVATAIFVTEPFSNQTRVKADAGRDPSDVTQVIKLNLVEDFPTGVYDYNMMTSSFVALSPVNGRSQGRPMKVSFTAQEWCGHVYHHVLFDRTRIREQLHSYFDGEADQQNTINYPADGMSEDVLLLWARGMAWPVLQPGQSVAVPMLDAMAHARLNHHAVAFRSASLSRSQGTKTVTVPAGEFEVYTMTARVGQGPAARTWTIHVEAAAPHRIVQWSVSDGRNAALVAVQRMPYWRLNGNQHANRLSDIGLSTRPPRTH